MLPAIEMSAPTECLNGVSKTPLADARMLTGQEVITPVTQPAALGNVRGKTAALDTDPSMALPRRRMHLSPRPHARFWQRANAIGQDKVAPDGGTTTKLDAARWSCPTGINNFMMKGAVNEA